MPFPLLIPIIMAIASAAGIAGGAYSVASDIDSKDKAGRYLDNDYMAIYNKLKAKGINLAGLEGQYARSETDAKQLMSRLLALDKVHGGPEITVAGINSKLKEINQELKKRGQNEYVSAATLQGNTDIQGVEELTNDITAKHTQLFADKEKRQVDRKTSQLARKYAPELNRTAGDTFDTQNEYDAWRSSVYKAASRATGTMNTLNPSTGGNSTGAAVAWSNLY